MNIIEKLFPKKVRVQTFTPVDPSTNKQDIRVNDVRIKTIKFIEDGK